MGRFSVEDPNGFEPDSEIDLERTGELREILRSTAWLEAQRVISEENLKLRLDLSRKMVVSSEDAARLNHEAGFAKGVEHVFQRLNDLVEDRNG